MWIEPNVWLFSTVNKYNTGLNFTIELGLWEENRTGQSGGDRRGTTPTTWMKYSAATFTFCNYDEEKG